MASMTGDGREGRRPWRPSGLADWEITKDITDPATGPERRAALEAERDARKEDRAAALEHAREVAARAERRLTDLLGAGVPS